MTVKDHAYGAAPIRRSIPAAKGDTTTIIVDTRASQRWYDFSVLVQGFGDFEKRHAGRVETGTEGITDPFMGSLR